MFWMSLFVATVVCSTSAFAAPTCVISSEGLAIKESEKLTKDANCTMTCIQINGNQTIENSCQVNVKAGGIVECVAPGSISEDIVGAQSSCDGAGSTLSVEQPK